MAKAAAIATAGNEQLSSWFSLVTVLSTWELRNHCRSDPVQVQSTTGRGSRKAFAAKSKSDALVCQVSGAVGFPTDFCLQRCTNILSESA